MPSNAQKLNKILHTEPYASLFHGIFWTLAFTIAFPLAGWAFLTYTLIQFLFLRPFLGSQIHIGSDSEEDLCVYITGCDSGFGKDLAFSLADHQKNSNNNNKKGFFTVFAGCLTENGMKQFEDIDNIIPIQVDVTNDQDVAKAAEKVSEWLNTKGSKPRYLHAVVNNAGMGAAGLIDWTDISIYQKTMDVNYFGAIRTTKSFLDILKKQSYEKKYESCRIVNVSSIAGLFSGSLGSSIYGGTKHAIEAFSCSLRMELKAFNIQVCTINPSSHNTAMVSDSATLVKAAWDRQTPEIQKQYGPTYLKSMLNAMANLKSLSWDPKFVNEALMDCILLENPPVQKLVGMDGRYFIALVRMFPAWLQFQIFSSLASKELPACMVGN